MAGRGLGRGFTILGGGAPRRVHCVSPQIVALSGATEVHFIVSKFSM